MISKNWTIVITFKINRVYFYSKLFIGMFTRIFINERFVDDNYWLRIILYIKFCNY